MNRVYDVVFYLFTFVLERISTYLLNSVEGIFKHKLMYIWESFKQSVIFSAMFTICQLLTLFGVLPLYYLQHLTTFATFILIGFVNKKLNKSGVSCLFCVKVE